MAEKPEEDSGEEQGDEGFEVSSPGFVTGIALARARAERGEADDEDARTLLREQARVLRLQAEHLHEQREVQLSHLKARRISEWIKVGLQLLAAVVGLAVAGLIGALVIGAASSRAVVVDAFDTPPALAARGVTGKVVASGVLDALTRLQDATRATAAKRRLSNAWGGDIKVEVPETGVSIGELKRLLHEILGRDVHVDGDLVQTAAGRLRLTVRGDGVLPLTFEGADDDLDGLTAKAAEYIYGEADPYLLAAYLSSTGRTDDALSFIAKAYPRAKDIDRPELLNQWGNALFALDRGAEAIEKYRAAIVLRPDFWKGWGNLVRVTERVESEEAAYHVGLNMLAAASQYPSTDQPEPTRRTTFDALLQDWPAVYRDTVADMKAHGAPGSYSTPASVSVAAVDVELHDWAGAAANIEQSGQDDPTTAVARGLMQARQSLEIGDAAVAITVLAPLYATYQSDARTRAYYPSIPCELGLAYGLAGRFVLAEQTLVDGPRGTSCTSFKGIVLDRAGDPGGATRAYRASIALAPDLPFPYFQYGQALLRRGDPKGALAQFVLANTRGPHWADPLKGWGDALAAQGRWSEAAVAYASALSYAPRWDAARTTLANARAAANRNVK